MIHILKGCSIVNEAGVDIFLEFSCIFYDPTDVCTLISGSCDFSKSTLNIWKSLVHVLLKPSLEKFKNYFASMWNECNCVVVWTFFGIALFGIEMKTEICTKDTRNNKWAKRRSRTQVHTQKSITFLCFKNEQLEIEILKGQLTIAPKKQEIIIYQILIIIFCLYIENYTALIN